MILVHFRLEFQERGTSLGGFKFQPVDEGTKVTWYMQLHDLKYPVGRWLGAFMPSMMKQDFHKGLENMENVLVN